MSEELQMLVRAVDDLHAARDRAASLCPSCGAARTLNVERAVTALIFHAEQLAKKERIAA